MKRSGFLLLAGLFSGFAALAQDVNPPVPEKTGAMRLVPQQFIAKTFQLDFEKALGNTTSIQFSPSITAGDDVLGNGYQDVIGGGMELTTKFYVGSRERKLEGFYAGLSGAFHKFKMNEPETVQYDQQGNPIFFPGQTIRVNRYAAYVTFGHQFIIQNIVALDLYAGGGLRIGDDDQDINDQFYYTNIFDFQYTGVAPKVGLSVGILF